MTMIRKMRLINLRIILLSTLFACANIYASDMTVLVTNKLGKPIENAVVYFEPNGNRAIPEVSTISIAQKNKTFIPLVSVAQVGTQIQFPNQDSVKHHVYSFSPAKTFELKLYSGTAPKSIVFDKAGTVVLGCNIHDNMLAFIHIVDTPYFAKTDTSGTTIIKNLPKGKYTLKVWHYATVKENTIYEQVMNVNQSESLAISIDIQPI